jgi:hypothetical protein
MLGPDVNEAYQQKYDKMMAGPNKFKPGDIITDFKNNLRTVIIRPAKDWVRDVGGSMTWRVNSVEPNGDYKLQRLYTLTTEPIKIKGTPIYQPEKTTSKEMIDYWSSYKIWDADDVKAIYNVGLTQMKKEKELDAEVDAYIKNEIAELTPKVQRYVNNSKKKYGQYTIDETFRKFERDLPAANRLDKMEFLWNMIDENKLKEASDYNYVKEQLFRKDDNDYENFKTATSHILQDGQKENASARSVLGNEDLLRTIDQYFRKSKRGGEKKKTSKKAETSKKKRTSKKRRKTLL